MSLSRVFKSDAVARSDVKTIPFKEISFASWTDDETDHAADSRELMKEAERKAADMLQQADEQIANAMQQLQDAREQWEEEKLQLQKQAYEEAFQQGFEEGRDKGYNDVSHLVEQAKNIVEQSKKLANDHLDDSEFTILEIAMTTATTILSSTLEDPERFLPVVRKGIKEAREMKEVKVYVALDQYALLVEQADELKAIFPADAKLYIFPEEELEPFHCIIESQSGRIDVSVDTQLQEMKRKLIEILGEES